jgi:hypothetical protein
MPAMEQDANRRRRRDRACTAFRTFHVRFHVDHFFIGGADAMRQAN